MDSTTFQNIENVTVSWGNDRILGNASDNVLNGWRGNDTINGGAGEGTILGGAGVNQLTGGAGADVFEFNLNDTVDPTSWGMITDFDKFEGDKIDLSDLSGPDGFDFAGFGGPSEGDIWLTASGDGITVHVDTDGNGTADGQIFLQGINILTAPLEADFIL